MDKKQLNIKGKVFKFADSVDTDQIIPARFLDTSDPEQLASHCMSGVDEDFSSKVKPGDIIVAGKNFGCGSSREHAPLSIKGCGIAAVVAESFARIFFRNAINIGLPIIECTDFKANTGEEISIDLEKGHIENLTTGDAATFSKFPEFLSKIIASGGLMEKAKKGVAGE
ncbi:MAG: 3-isopropylmalate dehydratase small subunit [Elusimicrobia bacterium]|jgi:3-isopropylmalate/(R)-2-methylmalate dehydratase small subunit|nr:3-isopropylmalate dehydratase small subunit [Elusimicrobiota bacterium]